jgi:hypothetical protein
MDPALVQWLVVIPVPSSLGQSSGNLDLQRMSLHSAQVSTGVGPNALTVQLSPVQQLQVHDGPALCVL